jgi:hypothetical protein
LIKKSGSIFFIKPGTHEKFDFAIDESKAQIITDYNEASFIRRVLNVENENYISIAFGKASLNTDNLAINDYRYDYVNMGGNSIGGFNKSAVLSSKSHLQSIPEKKLLEYIQHLKAKRGEEAKSRFEERKKFRMKYPSVTNVDFSAMTSNDLTNLQKILKK